MKWKNIARVRETQNEIMSVGQKLPAQCLVPSRGKNVNHLFIFSPAVPSVPPALGASLDPISQVPLDSLCHVSLWLGKQPWWEGLVNTWRQQCALAGGLEVWRPWADPVRGAARLAYSAHWSLPLVRYPSNLPLTPGWYKPPSPHGPQSLCSLANNSDRSSQLHCHILPYPLSP